MQKMRLFVDTHDKRNGTFPETIGRDVFGEVFKKYTKACEEEGVVRMKPQNLLTNLPLREA